LITTRANIKEGRLEHGAKEVTEREEFFISKKANN
jgi:hypothetical protein